MMKMSAATIPTKHAASSSMPSMKRSIRLRTDAAIPAHSASAPRFFSSACSSPNDRIGVLHLRCPFRLQRLRSLAPCSDLLRCQLVNFVPGLGCQQVAAGVFPVCPGAGDLLRPLGRAVAVDHRLLRRRHAVILRLVHHPHERRGEERHVHVVFHHLVDAEQDDRVPGKGDCIGHAAFQHLARLGCGCLHIRPA